MKRETLIVFAKPPRIGLAKTRLARGVGKAAARRIAHFTLMRTLRAARGSGCRTIIYTSPDCLVSATTRADVFKGFILRPQGPGTLTDRLDRALQEAQPGGIIFIGSDSPDLSAGLIVAACRALSRSDAVFGPAQDGGFWLFGMHKGPNCRSPFRGVRWSSPHALQDVRAGLPEGALVTYLPVLIDIDEAGDWSRWSASRH